MESSLNFLINKIIQVELYRVEKKGSWSGVTRCNSKREYTCGRQKRINLMSVRDEINVPERGGVGMG